jgi:hypothetical protein
MVQLHSDTLCGAREVLPVFGDSVRAPDRAPSDNVAHHFALRTHNLGHERGATEKTCHWQQLSSLSTGLAVRHDDLPTSGR